MPEDSVGAVSAEYINCRRSEGYACNTIKNDAKVLGILCAVVGADLQMDALTARHMDTYFAHRSATCAPSTLNTDLGCLKAWIKWCRGRDYLRHDPLVGRRWRKVQPRTKVFVPADDFPRVLDCSQHPIERVVMSLGLNLFLRASELTPLRLSDVDMRHGRIRVTVVKTKDLDHMPISDQLGVELDRWLGRYGALCGPLQPEWHLCPRKVQASAWDAISAPGEANRVIIPTAPIGRLVDVVQGVLVRAGYPCAAGTREGEHTLRRSGALRLYRELSERGHDAAIRVVSTMLHHSTIAQTEDYLDMRLDRVQRDKLIRGTRFAPEPRNQLRAIS